MRTEPSKAEMGLYTWGTKTPRDYKPIACYVINVAGLRDPQSNRGYSKKYTDGRPGEVQDYVKEDPRYSAILDQVSMLAYVHLRSEASSKEWLSIGIVDYHGKWIAPAIAEAIAEDLAGTYNLSVFHYDLVGVPPGVVRP